MVTFFVKIDSCAEHPRRKPVAASAASNTFQGKLLPVKNTYTFPELYNPVIFGQPTCQNNTAISPRSPSCARYHGHDFDGPSLFSRPTIQCPLQSEVPWKASSASLRYPFARSRNIF